MTETSNEVSVTYKARGDFRSLIKSTLEAKAATKSLNDEMERGGKVSAASAAATASARRKEAEATRDTTKATQAATKAQSALSKGVSSATTALRKQNEAVRAGERAARDASVATRRVAADSENAGKRAESMGRAFENAIRKMLGIKSSESAISGSLNKIRSGLDKISDWRPNLVPSFATLIPLFAGLLSLVNPLIAGIGALGAAAIGAASSLGTLAGAAVGLVPALTAALGVALALRVALGGVGAAIKAGVTPKSTTGGTGASKGSSGSTKQDPYGLSGQEKITRAQEAYKDSIQDVHFAEENLYAARTKYQRQVQDLTRSIQEYTSATKAADEANIEQAQQNYANVLASSASTKADKDAALAQIQEAQNKAQDDAAQNVRDRQDLKNLTQDGQEGSQDVVDAKRQVQDARNARRDAQLALKNARYDAAHPVSTGTAAGAAGGTAAGAADPYQQALSQLSPAAQQFVKWVVGMRSAWMNLQKTVQQAFFDKFVGDLDRLKMLIPPVRSALVDIAGALGKIADGILRQITGPDWRRDIILFGHLLGPILLTAGKGLQALLDAFRDLTIAATPFLGKVVGALAKGAEDFASFISNGRKTGSIKSALDTVLTVMNKWWTVISNISATLYNYGKAAAPFGQWLTDGIVKLTGAWKDASETATKVNSPFKRWLEDVKPLLKEMGTDLGDFFSWIGQVASNKQNISTITDLLKAFRTKVAPGIADILQTLVTAKVPQAVVDFVSALVGFIDTLVKDGGAKGFTNFFTSLTAILNALTDAAKSPAGKFITNSLLPLIGALAPFALPIGPVSLFLRLLGALTDFKPGSAISKVGSWLSDIAGGVGDFVGPAFAGAATVIGDVLGFLSAPIVLPSWTIPKTGPNSGPMALMKSIDPKAAIKAANLAIIGFATGIPGLIAKFAGDAFRTVGGPGAWLKKQSKRLGDWAGTLARLIGKAAGDVWAQVKTAAKWLSDRWQEFAKWCGNLAGKIARAAGDIWHSITGVGGWLGKQWGTFSTWLGGLPAKIGKALAGIWSGIPSLAGWVATQIGNVLGGGGSGGSKGSSGKKSSGFSGGGGGSFGTTSSKGANATGRWAGTITQALKMAGAPASWGRDISTIIAHESGGNASAINRWDINAREGHPSQGLMQTIPSTFNAYAGSLRGRGILDPLANVYAGIRYIMSRYGSPSNLAGIKSVARGGGWIGYSQGGLVPGQGDSDSVPARLTPGEYVLPRKIVDAIGSANLDAIRAGAKGFADVFGGLVAPVKHDMGMTTPMLRPIKAPQTSTSSTLIGRDFIVNVTPKDEPLHVSLPRTVRNLSYLHKGYR